MLLALARRPVCGIQPVSDALRERKQPSVGPAPMPRRCSGRQYPTVKRLGISCKHLTFQSSPSSRFYDALFRFSREWVCRGRGVVLVLRGSWSGETGRCGGRIRPPVAVPVKAGHPPRGITACHGVSSRIPSNPNNFHRPPAKPLGRKRPSFAKRTLSFFHR